MSPPNILWICTDQQRFDTLGCMGNTLVRTPNIDALAAGGVLFEHAYCQNPVCQPSRASFLTGRYPRTTGCRQNGQNIPASEVLVTKLLSSAGYRCGLSGKLHISACQAAVLDEDRERRIDDGYDEFYWSHYPGSDVEDDYSMWLRSSGTTFERSPCPESKWVSRGMQSDRHHATWCVERSGQFIERHGATSQPWMFSLNLFDPHHPFDPPGDFLDRYLADLDAIPLPGYREGELENKPRWQQMDHVEAYGVKDYMGYTSMDENEHRIIRAAYWAMCDHIDTQLGRLFEQMKQNGQWENTIVIFMSDHGEMLGDHGIYMKGPYFYDCAIRVPLILSWPGHFEPGRTAALTELVDIAPSLLEACGLQSHPGMQGKSLWPMLTGQAGRSHHREDVYCEHYNSSQRITDPTNLQQLTMVRTARYKLVAEHSLNTGELYDLEQDPGETDNLWDDSDAAQVKQEMLMRLCNRMAWTVDPLPERVAKW